MEVRNDKAKFQPGLYELLEAILAGYKKPEDLTEEDRAMLDEGIMDMASAKVRKPPIRHVPQVSPELATPPKVESTAIPTEDGQVPFWWLQ